MENSHPGNSQTRQLLQLLAGAVGLRRRAPAKPRHVFLTEHPSVTRAARVFRRPPQVGPEIPRRRGGYAFYCCLCGLLMLLGAAPQAEAARLAAPTTSSPGTTTAAGPALDATKAITFTLSPSSGAVKSAVFIRDLTTNVLVFDGETAGKFTGATFTLAAGKLAAGHAFRWDAACFDSAGTLGVISGERYFTTLAASSGGGSGGTTAPTVAKPSAPNPADGAQLANAASVTVSWTGMSGATYSVYLNGRLLTATATATSYTFTNVPTGRNVWAVYASKSGVTAEGPNWSFTLAEPVVQTPVAPTIVYDGSLAEGAPGPQLAAAPVSVSCRHPVSGIKLNWALRDTANNELRAAATTTATGWTLPAGATLAGHSYVVAVNAEANNRTSADAVGYFSLAPTVRALVYLQHGAINVVQARGGEAVAVTLTLANDRSVASGAVKVLFKLAASATVDSAADLQMGEVTIESVPAGGTLVKTFNLTVPAGALPGIFSVVAVLDPGAVSMEVDHSMLARVRWWGGIVILAPAAPAPTTPTAPTAPTSGTGTTTGPAAAIELGGTLTLVAVPGMRLHVSGTVRDVQGRAVAAGTPVSFGSEILSGALGTTDANGAFAGDIPVPAVLALGFRLGWVTAGAVRKNVFFQIGDRAAAPAAVEFAGDMRVGGVTTADNLLFAAGAGVVTTSDWIEGTKRAAIAIRDSAAVELKKLGKDVPTLTLNVVLVGSVAYCLSGAVGNVTAPAGCAMAIEIATGELIALEARTMAHAVARSAGLAAKDEAWVHEWIDAGDQAFSAVGLLKKGGAATTFELLKAGWEGGAGAYEILRDAVGRVTKVTIVAPGSDGVCRAVSLVPKVPVVTGVPVLTNLSVLSVSGSGASAVILGMVPTGDPQLLLQAGTTTLGRLGVGNAAASVALSVSNSGKVVVTNLVGLLTNWTAVRAAETATGATKLEGGTGEAGMVLNAAKGLISMSLNVAAGKVVLGEIYRVGSQGELSNGSVLVPSGEATLGFVVTGAGTGRFLIRVPAEELADFGVSAGRDSSVVVRRIANGVGTVIGRAEDESVAARSAAQVVGAFPLHQGTASASVLVEVSAGAYTVEAVAKRAGAIMVELYRMP